MRSDGAGGASGTCTCRGAWALRRSGGARFGVCCYWSRAAPTWEGGGGMIAGTGHGKEGGGRWKEKGGFGLERLAEVLPSLPPSHHLPGPGEGAHLQGEAVHFCGGVKIKVSPGDLGSWGHQGMSNVGHTLKREVGTRDRGSCPVRAGRW